MRSANASAPWIEGISRPSWVNSRGILGQRWKCAGASEAHFSTVSSLGTA